MIVVSPLAFLTSIILALGLSTLILFLGTLVYEAGVRRRLRRWAQIAARYQESVALLIAGEIAPAELLRAVAHPDRAAVAELLLSYAGHVQLAEEQAMLVAVFRELGAVERAVGESRDWRWWIRTGATRRLGQMRDPESLGRLQALLRDRHPEVRTAALWSILQLDVEVPVEALLQAVQPGRVVSHLRVATLFVQAGRRVVPALCAFLANPTSSSGHAQALRLAGELHAFDAEPAILAALHSPEAAVREAACRALGKLESLGAFDGLVGALHDREWQVRAAAAEALGRMGDPAAVPELLPLLAESNPVALLAVTRALGALGPEGRAALQDWQHYLAEDQADGGAEGPTLAQQVLAEVLAEVGP